MKPVKINDRRSTTDALARQAAIDADIARYGESFARIYLADDGSLKMEHVPREQMRPAIITVEKAP